jgi:hypothetical protein
VYCEGLLFLDLLIHFVFGGLQCIHNMFDLEDLPRWTHGIRREHPELVHNAIQAAIAGFVLVGVVGIVRSLLHQRQSRSWLKLRRASPDPEKSDDAGKFAATQMKPTGREPGSK